MESQQQDILLKIRSYRSIIAAAGRLYTSTCWQTLKAVWLYLLLTALTEVAVILLVIYDLYFFVPLAAIALLLELLLWWKTGSSITQRPLRALWRPARRHLFLLIGITLLGLIVLLPAEAFIALPALVLTLAEWQSKQGVMLGDPQLLIGITLLGLIVLLPAEAFVALPALVLTLAEWQSKQGVMMGDPQTMPTYMPYATAAVWLLITTLLLCLRLFIVFTAYYAWGSAEAKHLERQQQKSLINI